MNIIVQANHPIPSSQLTHLATLSQATGISSVNARTWRLSEALPHPDVLPYCQNHQLDFAFVPQNQSLSDFDLVVMDMDSTLITIECINEIADMQGLKPQVAMITESAMRGEIDFAESLRQRVALLKGLEEQALQRVYDERLQLSPGAEKLIDRLQSLGIKTLLVSGGFDFFTERLKKRLNLDFTCSNVLEVVDGKITGNILGTILDARGKSDCLLSIKSKLSAQQVIAIGDGANDLEMMGVADVSIAYHAKPIVRARATYALNWVGLDGVLNLLSGPSEQDRAPSTHQE